MTDDDKSAFTTAIADGFEVRIEIGDNLIFGRPVRIEPKALFFEARGGSGVVSAYDLAHVSDVRVLASRVPRAQRRGGGGHRA